MKQPTHEGTMDPKVMKKPAKKAGMGTTIEGTTSSLRLAETEFDLSALPSTIWDIDPSVSASTNRKRVHSRAYHAVERFWTTKGLGAKGAAERARMATAVAMRKFDENK